MRGDGYGNTVGATLAVDRGRLINAPANVPEFSQKPTGGEFHMLPQKPHRELSEKFVDKIKFLL